MAVAIVTKLTTDNPGGSGGERKRRNLGGSYIQNIMYRPKYLHLYVDMPTSCVITRITRGRDSSVNTNYTRLLMKFE